jgi:NADPH:quinone reductase-like Zn-dependent oxidoreductase
VAPFAADPDVDARAASAVPGQYGRAFRVGAVAVAPPREPHHGRDQIHALERDHALRPAPRARFPVGLALGALYDSGKLRPVIDSTFPFDQTLEAMAHVEQGRTKAGKVVVSMVPGND